MKATYVVSLSVAERLARREKRARRMQCIAKKGRAARRAWRKRQLFAREEEEDYSSSSSYFSYVNDNPSFLDVVPASYFLDVEAEEVM